MLVEGWLARAVRARPTHTALQTSAEQWSYSQLYEAACAGTAQLVTRGATSGTRVAISLPSGLAFAQALHACLMLGAIAVPVDTRLATSEQEQIIADCEVILDEPLSLSAENAQACWHAGTHELDATAVVIHTSGTTSAPRPVELTYANILWSALGSGVALGIDHAERWLCALPLSHVGGLSILLRSAIGATSAVMHERFELELTLQALRDEQITLVSLVATTLARLLDAGLERPPALRCALTGGGPVPATLLDRARAAGVPVALTYGLTEACSQVSTTPIAQLGKPANAGTSTAGPPLFCTRVQIASDAEILVRGPTVAPGALAADGWLHTGDLGSVDESGRLAVTGRKADTIVSGGENVAPAEVEAVLEAHAGVLEAAVLGRADTEWGEAVTAIVVARSGASLDELQLRNHCAAMLASYKVPKQFVLSTKPLPRTRSGKLLRRELA